MKILIKKIQNLTFLEILEKIYIRILLKFNYKRYKEFSSIKAFRSISEDLGSYLKVVREAITDDKKFNKFKSNPFYNIVLEHTTYNQGLQYLKIIKRDSNLLNSINKFIINDEIGNPKTYYYDELKQKISPSTLRYIKVASDIKKIFQDEITNIVEIGGGYGGQYLILEKAIKIDHYTLVDLYDINKLTEKYLEHHLLNSSYNTTTLNKIQSTSKFDLVISNYAFSELPPVIQIKYLEKIIQKSKNGYLTMNSGAENSVFRNHLSLTEIRNYIKDITILKEEPLSYEGNYIIVWGNIKKH